SATGQRSALRSRPDWSRGAASAARRKAAAVYRQFRLDRVNPRHPTARNGRIAKQRLILSTRRLLVRLWDNGFPRPNKYFGVALPKRYGVSRLLDHRSRHRV